MAENQILIKFKPDGHEKLIKAINLLSTAQKKLTDSVNKVEKSSKKLSKKTGVLDTNNKRLAQTNTALANSFATIRSKMLLWSFAMSLGIRQLIEFTKEAATLKAMETAFNTLSGGTNNATIAIDKLKEATNNTMSEFDLFQQANNAMILGITKNSDEMAEMFDIAQRLGRALGKDTRMSVESLITGIGRQSRLMLDNIGIIVKADEAYEAYAQRLGKTTDALSDAEKKQAFLTATMESARAKVNSLGGEVLSETDSFSELSASMDDLQARIGDAILAFEPLINLASSFADAITSERIDRFIRAIGLIIDIFKVLAGVIAVIVIPPLLYFVGIGGTISAIVAKISSSFILAGATALTASYGVLAIKDAITKYLDPAEKLTEQQKRFNEAFEQGADTLADEDIGSSFETLEEEMLRYGSSVETVTDAIKAQQIVNELYPKTQQAQLDFLNTQIELLEKVREEIEITQAFEIVLESLIAKRDKLKESMEGTTNGVEEEITARQRLLGVLDEEQQKKLELAQATLQIANETLTQFNAMTSAMSNQVNTRMNNELTALRDTEKFKRASSKRREKMEEAVTSKYAKERERVAMFEKGSAIAGAGINTALAVTKALPNLPLAALIAAMGAIQIGYIAATPLPKFATGGLVGGRRHSQGGTMIEAEQGEFVMSRNATEAIGIENLNRMNQGGGGAVNVTFTGNVMSQDFIENDAIPQIKEAIRRGADIGVS
tara:strand:+ start:15 stop:2186 length:2172 start_codon:yes stop_codon:yes gene_type:complete